VYFHPLILTEAQKRQRSAAYQECARLWLDGIDRQHRLHTDAVSELAFRLKENSRALSESSDATDFFVRCFACTASVPLELLQVSARAGEIAVDVQREVVAILGRYARELSNNTDPDKDASLPPNPHKIRTAR